MKRIAFAVALTALLAAGCATGGGGTYWYKAGASRQERGSDGLACKQMAYQTLPPQRMSGGGTRTEVNVGTSQGGGFAEGFSRGFAQGQDISARSQDLNAGARASLLTDCLRSKGYRQVSEKEYCQLYGKEAFQSAGCK